MLPADTDIDTASAQCSPLAGRNQFIAVTLAVALGLGLAVVAVFRSLRLAGPYRLAFRLAVAIAILCLVIVARILPGRLVLKVVRQIC